MFSGGRRERPKRALNGQAVVEPLPLDRHAERDSKRPDGTPLVTVESEEQHRHVSASLVTGLAPPRGDLAPCRPRVSLDLDAEPGDAEQVGVARVRPNPSPHVDPEKVTKLAGKFTLAGRALSALHGAHADCLSVALSRARRLFRACKPLLVHFICSPSGAHRPNQLPRTLFRNAALQSVYFFSFLVVL